LDYDRLAKWSPPKLTYSDEPGTPGIRPDISDPNALSSDPDLTSSGPSALSPGQLLPSPGPKDDAGLPVPRISPERIPEPTVLDPVLPDPTPPATEPEN